MVTNSNLQITARRNIVSPEKVKNIKLKSKQFIVNTYITKYGVYCTNLTDLINVHLETDKTLTNNNVNIAKHVYNTVSDTPSVLQNVCYTILPTSKNIVINTNIK